ncbi:hypothetical protein ZIOFF_074006 [Zingiber officinale]|uniref:Uncharacterized protein n=1 Tax=Zingiber officinale TaxID=94328 RepID=A0A8J5BZG5_ZINOF|nr:hypothetical protein ZIOFF_074006 [Zingiber officinale]
MLAILRILRVPTGLIVLTWQNKSFGCPYLAAEASNILLDEGCHDNPKLSDFGLAKLGPTGDKMSVVYSFGVVFVELITRRRAITSKIWFTGYLYLSCCFNLILEHDEVFLLAYAQAEPLFKDKRKFVAVADPLLEGKYPP